MFSITEAILAIAFSYLIGSIPIGLIVARIAGGIDIREHGSGNIGLTNVVRTLGWGPGLITGVVDFLKGYVPVYLTMMHFNATDFGGVSLIYEAIVMMVAAAIVLGNLYPVYLLFKGGKGIATGLGVMSALMGVFIFIPIAIFGLILLVLRFVSLASIASAFSVPLTIMALSSHIQFIHVSCESPTARTILILFSWIVFALIAYSHRANIFRILKGTEPRIGKPRDPQVAVVGAETPDPPSTKPEFDEVIIIEDEEEGKE